MQATSRKRHRKEEKENESEHVEETVEPVDASFDHDNYTVGGQAAARHIENILQELVLQEAACFRVDILQEMEQETATESLSQN